MNVRWHFLPVEALLGAGYKTIRRSDNVERIQLNNYLLWISKDTGAPYMDIDMELLTSMPPDGIDYALVTKVTCHAYVTLGRRAFGTYELGTARATLGEGPGPGPQYRIAYEAKNFDDLKALHKLICEGTIAPTIDFGSTQMPIVRIDPDAMKVMEERAAALAMKLLGKAMRELEATINR